DAGAPREIAQAQVHVLAQGPDAPADGDVGDGGGGHGPRTLSHTRVIATGWRVAIVTNPAGSRRHRRPPLPDLGNGGYDVWHYDVAWRYPTAAPATPVT